MLSSTKTMIPHLLVGGMIGVVTAYDPIIANYLSGNVDMTVLQRNVFKLFPFEITSLVFLSVLLIFVMAKICKVSAVDTEKAFIVITLITSQTSSLLALSSSSNIDASDFAALAFLGVLFCRGLMKQGTLRFTTMEFLNLILLIAMLLSVINGSFYTLAYLAYPAKAFILAFLVINFVKDRDSAYYFIKVYILVTAISAVIAIVQEIAWLTAEVPLIGFVSEKNMKLMFESSSMGKFLRVPAFTGLYRNLIVLVLPCLMIVWNLLLYEEFQKKRKWLLVGCVFILLVTLFLTFSKDALLSAAVGMFVSVILWRPRYILHTVLLSMLVGIVVIAGRFTDYISEYMDAMMRWQPERDRLQLAREAIVGIMDRHTYIGNGLFRSFLYTSHLKNWPPHNCLLSIACDIGIVGLLAYLLILAQMVYTSAKLYVLRSNNRDKCLSIGLSLGMICVFLDLQFHGAYIITTTWMVLGFLNAFHIIMRETYLGPAAADRPREDGAIP